MPLSPIECREAAPKPRQRSVRRPFRPSRPAGPYRLPREVDDHLVPALTGFRNRAEAYQLATFLPRFWATPGRLTMAFPIAREALCLRRTEAALREAAETEIAKELGLTEKRIRSATATLETVGFLQRAIVAGNGWKTGGRQREPIRYRFGTNYGPLFAAANRRATAARARQDRQRRAIEARPLPMPRQPANGPGRTTAQADRVSPGPLRTGGNRPPLRAELVRREGPPSAAAAEGRSASLAPDPKLEAALARLGASMGR